MQRKTVILVTGVPGTGKTTTSRLLAESLRGKHLDVSEFALKNNLVERLDEKRGTKIVNMKALRSEIKKLLKPQTILVIDGHYSPDLIEPYLVSKVIVLRKAPWILRDELELRGYSQAKIRENVEAELVGSCLQDALDHQDNEKVCELDSTNTTPEEIVKQIALILKGDKQCLYGVIDWMSDPKTELLLKEM